MPSTKAMATANSQCHRGAPHRNGLRSSRVTSSAEPRLAPRAAQLMCWMLLVMASLLADRLQQHRTPSRGAGGEARTRRLGTPAAVVLAATLLGPAVPPYPS